MNNVKLASDIIAGHALSKSEAVEFLSLDNSHIHEVLYIGSKLRNHFRKEISTCTIANAKNGRCSEDCAYCAQSVHHDVKVECYGLRNTESIVDDAGINSQALVFLAGASSIMTGNLLTVKGRKPEEDFELIREFS